jgi:hypothetical protein
VINFANNRPETRDIGLMRPAIMFTGITYIAGGRLHLRHRVVPRERSCPSACRTFRPRHTGHDLQSTSFLCPWLNGL